MNRLVTQSLLASVFLAASAGDSDLMYLLYPSAHWHPSTAMEFKIAVVLDAMDKAQRDSTTCERFFKGNADTEGYLAKSFVYKDLSSHASLKQDEFVFQRCFPSDDAHHALQGIHVSGADITLNYVRYNRDISTGYKCTDHITLHNNHIKALSTICAVQDVKLG